MKQHMKKNQKIIIGSLIFLVCIVLILMLIVPRFKEETEYNIFQAAVDYDGKYDPQRIIIRDTNAEELSTIADELGCTYRMAEVGGTGVLYLPCDMTVSDFLSKEQLSDILPRMQLDYYAELSSASGAVGIGNTAAELNCDKAKAAATGKGITVAVIDTGIDVTNPAFEGRISEKSYNVSQDRMVNTEGLSVVNDTNGHGTQVAGIIAASDSSEYAGLAPEAELLVICCNPNKDSEMNVSDLVMGLAHAIACDADIVNMSFSIALPADPFEEYVQLAVDSDIICVAAAGNFGSSATCWPASNENVIGVGYTVSSGEIGLGSNVALGAASNFGDNCNLVAPGTYNLIPNKNETSSEFGDVSNIRDGSSFSCAATSGAIALYLSSGNSLGHEVASVKEVLFASCKDLGDAGEDWYYGFGALDVDALVVEEKGTITFDFLTDELQNETHVFVRNHTLQSVPDPERTYAVFDGWYYDANCANEYDNLTKILTDDITVYALWVNEDDTLPYQYIVQDDGTAKITGYTGRRRHLTVPSRIDGYTVTAIGERAFKNNTRLRTIELPNTLVNICSEAFSGCVELRNILIPSSVQEIGREAFYSCAKLSTVGIPASGNLTRVGDYAFAYCGRLSRFDIPAKLKSINATAFYSDLSMITITADSGNAAYRIVDGALVSGSRLIYYPTGRAAAYTVPEGIVTIDAYAFAYSQTRSITFIEGLKNIDENAFEHSRIDSLVFPESMEKLGAGCFRMSTGLKAVTINNNLEDIPQEAFMSCFCLTDFNVPDGAKLHTIGNDAFNGCRLQSVFDFSERLTEIGSKAFSNNRFTTVKFGKDVKIGNNAFEYCTNLNEVQFGEDSQIKSLPAFIFYNCVSLKEIELPDSIKEISEQCFAYSGIEKIYIGSGVEKIDVGAFSACGSLNEVTINESNKAYLAINGVLFGRPSVLEGDMSLDGNALILHTYPAGKNDTVYVIPENAIKIAAHAFAGAYNLETVSFNDNMGTIDSFAFQYCKALKSIALNDNVTEIGLGAFYECSSLRHVSLNEGLKSILGDAFAHCYRLSDIEIPSTVQHIGTGAFNYDFNLTSITFAEGSQIKDFGMGAFEYCGITSFCMPASVEFISLKLFDGCTALKNVVFEDGSKLQAIPAWTFRGADNLQSVEFGADSALVSIQARAFEYLSELKNIDLQNCKHLTNIDNYAFQFCSNLTELQLPDGLTNIGRYAFYGCSQLAELQIPASVVSIGEYAFAYCKPVEIYFASAVLPAELDENWDYGIKGYYCDTTGRRTSSDGLWEYAVLSDGTVSIISYSGSDEVLSLTEIDGHEISAIGSEAFKNNTRIRQLTLPDSLKTIFNSAFEGTTALERINIPASVSHIGSRAFCGSAIAYLEFADNSQLQTIASFAFENTNNLHSVLIPAAVQEIQLYAFHNSAISELTFAENASLSYIGNYAFSNCNISSITIPGSVRKIGYHCFEGDKNLEAADLSAPGSIMIYGYAFYNTGLNSVSISEKVTYIGEFCFSNCENLKAINVAENSEYYRSENGVLFNKSGKKLICCPAGKTGSYSVPADTQILAFGAFEGSRLSEVNFPESSVLATVGYRAFYNAVNLKSVELPSSILSIDYFAFANCRSLADIEISADCYLNGIYESAFYNCSSLRQITIPESVKEIGKGAFYGCENLSSVIGCENSGMMEIGDEAFAHTAISEFGFPSSLIEIGREAFAYTNLSAFTPSPTIEYVGPGVLKGCKITDLTLTFMGSSLSDQKSGTIVYTFGNEDSATSVVPSTLRSVCVLNCPAVQDNAFYEIASLERVELNGATTIGYSAFTRCTNLKEIVTGGNVTNVGSYAFYECSCLESADFLEAIKETGYFAFYKCTALIFPDLHNIISVADDSFRYCNFSGDIDLSQAETIGQDAFRDTTGLRSVLLSNSLKSMESGAFAGSSVTSVNIPGSISAVPFGAFWDCDNLSEVILEEGITEIGANAFSSCGLMEIEFPSSLRTIGDYAFHYSDICRLKLNSGLKSIGREAFSSLGYPDVGSNFYVFIPRSVETIGELAFDNTINAYFEAAEAPNNISENWDGSVNHEDCSSYFPTNCAYNCQYIADGSGAVYIQTGSDLHLVQYTGDAVEWNGSTTENGVITDISAGAFYGNQSVQKIVCPDSVQSIGYKAAEGCSSLKNLVIGSSVVKLEDYAFCNCLQLEKVVIPEDNSLETIGEGAFSEDTSLSEFDFEALTNLKRIDVAAFRQSAIEQVDLSNSSKLEYPGNFAMCSLLKSVKLPDNYSGVIPGQFVAFTGVSEFTIPDKVTTIEPWAFEGSALKSISIPDGVTQISGGTFARCYSLKEIKILGDITEIGGYAFNNVAAEKINIPGSVTSIGEYAFADSKKLTIYFEATELPETLGTNWDQGIIGYYLGIPKDIIVDEATQISYAVADDGSAVIYSYGGSAEELVLDEISGAPIKMIMADAFKDNESLKSVKIGGNVEEIAQGAFTNCSNLETVDLSGAYALNTIGENAFTNCSSLQTVDLSGADMLNTIGENAFENCSKLQEIIIVGPLKEIPASAFKNCIGLEKVSLPDGIETIQAYAFLGCTKLQNVEMPDSVKKIEASAFNGCIMLSEMNYPDSLQDVGYMALDGTGLLEKKDGYTFWETCLISMDNWENPMIPEGYTVLASYAVNRNMKEVILPSSMRSISCSCFALCSDLESITLNEGLLYIGEQAFRGCGLTSLSMPDTVTYIGKNAFHNTNLNELVIPFVGCTAEGGGTLDDTLGSSLESLKTLTISGDVKRIDKLISNNYYGNCSIEKLVFRGKDCEAIGDSAFYYFRSLRELQLPDGYTSIGERAFSNTLISEIEFCDSLRSISNYAFTACNELKSIALPEGVETIGEFAFSNCPALETVSIPNTVTNIGRAAFLMCPSLTELSIPFPGTSINEDGTVNGSLSDICDKSNSVGCKVTITGPVTAIKSKAFSEMKMLKEIVLPDTVTVIGSHAFENCSSLEKITLSDNVTSIESYAFEKCTSLSSVKWPSALKSIGSYAFDYTNIDSAFLPESIETIGGCAFKNCSNLKAVYLPDNLQSIGFEAFKYSGIEYAEIPESVTKCQLAFSGCPELKLLWLHCTPDADVVDNVETLVLDKVDAKQLSGCISADSDIKNVVLSGSVEAIPANFMEGFSSVNIYTQRVADSGWPEGWNADNPVYYRGAWALNVFRANNVIISAELRKPGGILKTPTESQCRKEDDAVKSYTFIGWDTDGNGSVDSKYSSEFNGIYEADAVYSVVDLDNVNRFSDDQAIVSDNERILEAYAEGKKINVTLHGIDGESTDNYDLRISSNIGEIVLNDSVCKSISADAVLTLEECDASVIDMAGAKDKVYVIKLTENGKRIDISSNGGKADISLPISSDLSDTECVRVYLLSDNGTEMVIPAVVDPAAGRIHFTSNTLGVFRVAVKTDVEMHKVSLNVGDTVNIISIAEGNALKLPAAVNGEKVFRCWSDGARECNEGEEIEVSSDISLSALWWEDEDLRSIKIIGEPGVISAPEGCWPDVSNVEIELKYSYGTRTVRADRSMLSQLDVNVGGIYEINLVYAGIYSDNTLCIEILHRYESKTASPTCTEKGYTTHTCACGESFVDSYVDALGHDFGEWKVTTAPSCTEKGKEARCCSRCDARETREAEALGHRYGEPSFTWTEYNSCEASFTCISCGDVQTISCEVSYKITDATCTVAGTTVYTAEVSFEGKTYTDTKTVVGKPAPHEYGEPVFTWNGFNCEAEFVCTKCGDKQVLECTVTSTVTKAASCTEAGVKLHTASVEFEGRTYSAEKSEMLEKKAHTPNNAVTENEAAAACTAEGSYDEVIYCSECVEELSRVHKTTEALGHDLVHHEGKAATCTEAGWDAYDTCSRCDYTTYKEIPATGHNYSIEVTSPTCTEKGYTTHTCACGESFVDDYVDALGHDFGEWIVTTAPSCTEKGEEARCCSRCDARETREAEALGHDLVHHEGKAATCTEAGWDAYDTCSRCDYTTYKEIPALGHSYKDGVCDVCGAKDSALVENPFADVSESSVYYDAILWAYYHEPQQITGGYTATEFRPGNPCTRGQVVTFLWRAAGCPEPTGDTSMFKDPSSIAAPYQKAVAWAVEKGITTGYNDGTFRPNDSVTRAQFVTFLWRYEGKPATSGSIAGFRDASSIAEPYQQAVAWAVEKGVTTGYNDGSFRPNDTCTRWAVVLFMYRDMK